MLSKEDFLDSVEILRVPANKWYLNQLPHAKWRETESQEVQPNKKIER